MLVIHARGKTQTITRYMREEREMASDLFREWIEKLYSENEWELTDLEFGVLRNAFDNYMRNAVHGPLTPGPDPGSAYEFVRAFVVPQVRGIAPPSSDT